MLTTHVIKKKILSFSFDFFVCLVCLLVCFFVFISHYFNFSVYDDIILLYIWTRCIIYVYALNPMYVC